MSDTDSPQTELMLIFDFTTDDLVANRRGQMTERQVTKMRSQLIDTSFLSIGMIVIAGAAIGIRVLASAVQLHPEVMRWLSVFACVGGIIIPIFVVGFIVYSLTTLNDLRQQTVRSFMCDFALKSYRDRNRVLHYELRACVKTVALTKQQFEKLQPVHVRHGKNAPYRFYLADSSGKLLSMELIPE